MPTVSLTLKVCNDHELAISRIFGPTVHFQTTQSSNIIVHYHLCALQLVKSKHTLSQRRMYELTTVEYEERKQLEVVTIVTNCIDNHMIGIQFCEKSWQKKVEHQRSTNFEDIKEESKRGRTSRSECGCRSWRLEQTRSCHWMHL